jgi:hypothetical protein
MNPITIHIPLEVQSQNVTDRMHWRVRHKTQAMWLMTICNTLRTKCGITGEMKPPTQRMAVTITAYRKRLITDHANLVGGAKMVCDAIRDAGLIHDDADEWAAFAYSQQLAKFSPPPYEGRPSTVLRIERFPTTPDTGKDDK